MATYNNPKFKYIIKDGDEPCIIQMRGSFDELSDIRRGIIEQQKNANGIDLSDDTSPLPSDIEVLYHTEIGPNMEFKKEVI